MVAIVERARLQVADRVHRAEEREGEGAGCGVKRLQELPGRDGL